MTVIPNSAAREAKKDEHSAVAIQAFRRLLKLSDYEGATAEDVFEYVVCHPQGRKQFLHYCAGQNAWRVDRIDDWEYYHVLALIGQRDELDGD